MRHFEVLIYRDREHVDTQMVSVTDHDLESDQRSRFAQNSIKCAAMVQTRVAMRGALVDYAITELAIGTHVCVADLFGGTIVELSADQLVVELDDDFDELPTDACYWSARRSVLWPCRLHVDEVSTC